MATVERSPFRCAWEYPYCTRIATKWLAKVPLCDDHYGPTLAAAAKVATPELFAPAPAPVLRFRPWSSVVYYVTWPDRSDEVKIGVSCQLSRRMVALRRADCGAPVILVAENGDHKHERRRHREFSGLRLLDPVHGGVTELFRREPVLDEHIRKLKADCPEWATYAKL